RRAGQLHPRGHPRTRRRGDRPAHPTEVRPGPLESALEPQQTAVPDATEQIALLTCESVGKVRGLELVEIDRPDECCGFGGSFCVTDEAVSAKMGYDRVHDFHRP